MEYSESNSSQQMSCNKNDKKSTNQTSKRSGRGRGKKKKKKKKKGNFEEVVKTQTSDKDTQNVKGFQSFKIIHFL